MKVKYYYDSENLVSQNKDKKEINLVLLSSWWHRPCLALLYL
jgi:hypothetical protein